MSDSTSTDLDLGPRTQNGTTKFQRDALDGAIAKYMLMGYNINGIVKEVSKEFSDVKLTRPKILAAFKRLNEEWHATKIEAVDFHIAKELERLDVMEEEAWRQYRSCGGTVKEEETKDLFDNKGNKRESLTVTKTKDDPRTAIQWFDKILKIQTDRRKVLKLETVVNINNVMAVKGYAIFNPSNDWPDPHLPDPNVIDAEFTQQN